MGIALGLPQELKMAFYKKANQAFSPIEWDIRSISRDCEINPLVREWKYEEDLFLPLWQEDYVLCIPDGHLLLEKDLVDLNDLSGEPFIHCPPCEAHQQCLGILNNTGDKWNTVANCASKTEVLTLLMAGIGITFLPEYLVQPWSGFETRPYKGPRYYREIGLSYPQDSIKNPAIENIINLFSK